MRKLIATLILAAAAAACSANTPVTPGAQPPAGSPSTSPSSTASEPPGKTTVTVYYVVAGAKSMYLAPERHEIDKTPAIAKAALDELLRGETQDDDHTVPFAEPAAVNSVVINDKVATVDWNADVLLHSPVGADVENLAIQSIVYTLTEFPTIAKVRFTVEGRDSGAASNGKLIEDFWGHVGLAGQPWDRDPAIDILEPITLWTPVEGAASSGSLKLTGLASTFEANVAIFLRDAKGKIVVQTSTTAAEAAPARAPFSKTITFNPPTTTQQWTVQVVEHSMEDGSVFFMEDRTITVG